MVTTAPESVDICAAGRHRNPERYADGRCRPCKRDRARIRRLRERDPAAAAVLESRAEDSRLFLVAVPPLVKDALAERMQRCTRTDAWGAPAGESLADFCNKTDTTPGTLRRLRDTPGVRARSGTLDRLVCHLGLVGLVDVLTGAQFTAGGAA